MDGIILINKPQNITSHDVVLKIRGILKRDKIGHYGTLDPLATGLIIIAVGKATRLFPFFSKTNKAYKGQIRFGFSTDTYDSNGKPLSPEHKEYPDRNNLLKAMKQLEGKIHQLPPPYSAKKYKGKPLYTLARKNKEYELRSSQVFIHLFQLTKYNPPYFHFNVKCSSGTYIRSLAHDLGQKLGCGAHLSALHRTEVGNFKIKESYSIEKINQLTQEGKIDEFLIPLKYLLPEFPKIILKKEGSALAKNGNMIYPENILKVIHRESSHSDIPHDRDIILRMFSPEGELLALARKVPEKECLHPFLVIESKDI